MDDLPAPPEADTRTPNAARMYDYYLGGAYNLRVDRDAADAVIAELPDMRRVACENRAFLDRAVRHLTGCGVRQFLDLGSGLPTVGNVHEIVQGIAPDARVVYVDRDPTAVAYAQQLLTVWPGAEAVLADLRDPAAVLGSGPVRRLLDLDRPVGLLMCAVLHFVPDTSVSTDAGAGDGYSGPAEVVAAYRDALAPGSFLVLSHGTGDGRDSARVRAGVDVYARTATPAVPRSRAQVDALFAGWRLLEPGVVWVSQWQPGMSLDPGHNTGHTSGRTSGDDGGEAGSGEPWRSGSWAGVAYLPEQPPHGQPLHGPQSNESQSHGSSRRGEYRVREKRQR